MAVPTNVSTIRLGMVVRAVGAMTSACGLANRAGDFADCRKPGLLLDAYKALAQFSQKPLRFVFVSSPSYGDCDPVSGNCTGLLELMRQGKIDGTVSCLARRQSRMQEAVFSADTVAAIRVFVVRDDGGGPRELPGKAFFPFRRDVLLCIVLSRLANYQ